MTIPAGIIVAWPSTAASIPSGWSRVSTLDDRYCKGTGAGVNPDVTGGATSHVHTSQSHTHSVPSHSHTGTTSSQAADVPVTTAVPAGSATHSHTYTSGAQTAQTAQDSTAWQSTTLDPTFFTVIWIESNGTPSGFPNGCIVFYNNASAPTGWTQHAASVGRYLKGAAAGGNGGSTGGSLAAHSHTAAAHTHGVSDHTHGSVTSGVPSATTNVTGSTGAASTSDVHTHSISFSAAATGTTASATSASTATTSYEPPFYKLLTIENTSGSNDERIGAIVAWRGLLSAIPSGYKLCDGSSSTPDLRNRFIKAAASGGGDLGGTGGTEGHDHTDPAGHTHSATGHTHVATAASTAATVATATGAGAAVTNTHGHVGAASASAGGASGSTVSPVDSNSATNPPFRTVAWLQLQNVLVVTIDDPTEGAIISDTSPLIDWSLSGGGTQVDFRVRIYTDIAETQLAYDSGTTASATTSHEVPIGKLQNNTDYYLRVDATDNSVPALTGTSAQRNFETSWTPPNVVAGLTLTPVGGT